MSVSIWLPLGTFAFSGNISLLGFLKTWRKKKKTSNPFWTACCEYRLNTCWQKTYRPIWQYIQWDWKIWNLNIWFISFSYFSKTNAEHFQLLKCHFRFWTTGQTKKLNECVAYSFCARYAQYENHLRKHHGFTVTKFYVIITMIIIIIIS